MADALTITWNDGRKTVPAKTGMSLFAACRAAGFFLPSACGAGGRCGMCKVRVTAGALTPPTEAEKEKLSAADLADGWRLACQAKAAGGDLAAGAPEDAFAAREFAVTVQRIDRLTHDIVGVRLRPEGGAKLSFRAGQYLSFAGKPYGDVRFVPMRAFSIASAPEDGEGVSLVIRRTPKGLLTPWVFEHMKEGDATKIVGPFGGFGLRDTKRPAFFLAGGSGLSPFLSILRDAADKGCARPISLFFGAVTRKDLYLLEYFEVFQSAHPWFHFVPALSGDEGDASFERGLVTDVLARHAGRQPEAEGYICGSPGMIGAGVKVFKDIGIPDERIYFDRF
jgi:Na+-transporting NADH:ubiquinone oxidoreductase subunit F